MTPADFYPLHGPPRPIVGAHWEIPERQPQPRAVDDELTPSPTLEDAQCPQASSRQWPDMRLG
jgi:hypothetical protein